MGPLLPVQILIERKGADPSATTAREAIRDLLGFGMRLAELRRRRLLELMIERANDASAAADGSSVAAPREILLRYLDRTTLLWNPNKERAWVRIPGQPAFEVAHGQARDGRFGQPALDDAEWDHVLVWNRDTASTPEDLRTGLAPLALFGSGSAELWSAHWRTETGAPETEGERKRLTAAIGMVKTRGEGFLVNPHFQDHRLLHGAVPMPLWGSPE